LASTKKCVYQRTTCYGCHVHTFMLRAWTERVSLSVRGCTIRAQCSLAAAGETSNGRRRHKDVTSRDVQQPYSVLPPEQLFALRPCRIRRPFRLDARGSVVRAWTARGGQALSRTLTHVPRRPVSPFRCAANVLLTYPMPPSPEFRPPPKTPRRNKSRSLGPRRNRKTLLSLDVQ